VAVTVLGVALSGAGRGGVAGGDELSAALALVDRPVAEAGAPAPEGESFPTEQAKQEAIAAALTRVRQDRPGSEVAVAAALPLAGAQLQLGKLDEALALYDEYLKDAPENAPLRFLAYEGKARAQVAKNDLEAAAATWNEMEKAVPGYADRAIFGRGQLLARQGKYAEAKEAFDAVKGFAGGSTLSGPAGERIADMERLQPSVKIDAPPPAPTAVSPAGG
jgi:tetratricopeptide (TPR) repeat protein